MSVNQVQRLFSEASDFAQERKWSSVIATWNKAIPLLRQHKEFGHDELTFAYTQRGSARLHMGDYGGALSDFGQAIEVNPRKDSALVREAHYNRAIALSEAGVYLDAIADFDRVIEIYPQYTEAYYKRGLTKIKMGNYEGAIADFDQAIVSNPQFADAYSGRGATKSKTGDHDGAIADFDQAFAINPQITIDPQFADAYYKRGVAKSNAGDHKGAIAYYSRALEINPEHKNASHDRAAMLTLQASEKGREQIEAQYKEQLRAQQEQFDRERERQLQMQREQQNQFDRAMQVQLQKQREQQEHFALERKNAEKERQEEKRLREAGTRIIYSKEYERTLKKCNKKVRQRGGWVWRLSGALALAAVAIYGYIAYLGIEAWQAAQSPMAMRNFSALSLFPFILIGTLVLSPLAWAIRMLNRDKHKYWVLRQDAAANLNLLRIIETGDEKREDLWLQLFDHHDKRSSAHLIADWNHSDGSSNNFTINPGDKP